MKNSLSFLLTLLFVTFIGLSLTGYGSGGDENSSSDAPIDGATHVIVQFTGVEVKLASGEKLNFNFDSPKQIDLLALKSGLIELLLGEENLPAGHYNWIRLKVEAELGVLDSYIELDDGSIHSLWIPNGSQTGLKLINGFDILAGGFADFTIDFNLRKSVHNPSRIGDDYIPTLIRFKNIIKKRHYSA
jgi:hypothetical protein